MPEPAQHDLRAVLEGIVYGTDPAITPADRLRAAEQLQGLGDDTDLTLLREALALGPDALDGEFDAYVARRELPRLLDDAALAQRWPLCAAALQRVVQERAEAVARVLADADRLEREVQERAQALAQQLYEQRAFRAVQGGAGIAGAGAGDGPPAARGG